MSTSPRSDRRAFLRVAGGAVAVPALLAWRAALGTPMSEGPVTAFTLIHGIPGREADLQAHLVSLSAPTRAEAGCMRYDLYQHPEKRHEFLRFEVWGSFEALEAHKKTPHLRASFEKRQREGWTTEIVLWNRVAD